MAMHLWWLYVTAVFLIAGTPGPNMLHVMVQSIHHGPRRAVFSMAGLMSAVLLCLLASAMGLGALLQASPRLYGALRFAGAAYLIWLGIKAWRAPVSDAPKAEGFTRSRPGALYAAGLGTGLPTRSSSSSPPRCSRSSSIPAAPSGYSWRSWSRRSW